MALEQLGLAFQIVGVLVVLYGQVKFYLKTQKEGGLFRAFHKMLTTQRLGKEKYNDEKDMRKIHPEASNLADYFSEDIRDSAIGLIITVLGLFIEFLATLL